jgi:hypothetical protein
MITSITSEIIITAKYSPNESLVNSKYAVLDLTDSEFSILSLPYKSLKGSKHISLIDVFYKIQDGILYIRGTQIYWDNLWNIGTHIELWGTRSMYEIPQETLDLLENPPLVEDLFIKRWWRNNLKVRALLVTEDTPHWYKYKEENLFEIAISGFKILETFKEM